jgi:hypothetical protein
MKTLITTLLGCLLYLNTIAQNAATSVWTDSFGLQDTVLKIPTVIDNLGNLYVAGSTINGSSGPDIVIKKYDNNGDPVFDLTYSSAGYNRDQATTIAIDNNYNLIVGGFSYVNATNSYDFLVLKYDSAGTLLWTYTYNGTGSAADLVSAMALDSSNIYITGASVGISSLFDFTTIKLNSAGNVQWNNRYNYLASDLPIDIDIIDTNIYVNGGSQSTMTNWDYALLHYSINGAPIDTIRTTGTGVGFDRATQAVTDNQGYIYITGTYATTSNGLDYKTIKFDQQGNVKWISTFDNTAHQDDIANAIAVDFDGNVYITGKTFNSMGNYDYCTIKYDSLGTEQWTRFYDNKYYDEATSITVDSYNNVYVTGSSSNTANKDFTTIGYGTSGDTLWTKRFNGGYNGNDEATSIIVENGFVYVSGQTQINSTQYKNVTIAYGQAKIKEIPDLLGEEKSSNLFYIPNDGQLANDTGAIASDVLFYVPNHYPSLFVNHHGLSYVFKKFTNDTVSNDTIHRIDMQFMRGNYLAKAVVYPNKEISNHYQNYYLPHCSNGVIDVRGSNMLMAKSLYEGIDLYYSSNQTGEKHSWVLAPNANYKAIKIKFNGADSVSTPMGKYTIHSSIGKLEYDSLVAYEIDAVGNIIIGTSQPMRLMLDTSSNSYYFKTFSYNTANTLVIMAKQKAQQAATPHQIDNLNWCTYVGSQSDALKDIKADALNNTFVTGMAGSPYYPTDNGISLIFFNEYSNMGITKFDSLGILKWSTIIGSNNATEGTALELGTSGSVFVTGYTNGTTFPIRPFTNSNNYYRDSIYSGNKDLVIVEMNDLGNEILWSSLYGGTGKEIGLDLVKDLAGNLYIYGEGDSLSPKVTNPLGTAYQVNNGGGLLLKFNPSKQLIWATNLDSLETDTLYQTYTPYTGAIAVDNKRNIYVTSNVKNGVIPEINPGTHGGSNFDCYLIKLSVSTNNIEWSTRIGSSKDDFSYDLAVNNATGDIYLCGSSKDSIGDFPLIRETTSSYYDTIPNTGSYDPTNAFLMKFDTDSGTLKHSTFYGGDRIDIFLSIALDNEGRLFLGGTTTSTLLDWPSTVSNGVYSDQTTNNASLLGRDDAMLVSFNQDGSLLMATFFGGNQHEERVHALTINGLNQLLIDGTTQSGGNILFPLADGYGIPYFDEIMEFPIVICGFLARFDLLPLYNGLNNMSKVKNDILLYPNPTNNSITVDVSNLFTKQVTLSIYSSLGTCVLEQNIPVGSNLIYLGIHHLQAGYYILRTSDSDKSLQTSFIKY